MARASDPARNQNNNEAILARCLWKSLLTSVTGFEVSGSAVSGSEPEVSASGGTVVCVSGGAAADEEEALLAAIVHR